MLPKYQSIMTPQGYEDLKREVAGREFIKTEGIKNLQYSAYNSKTEQYEYITKETA